MQTPHIHDQPTIARLKRRNTLSTALYRVARMGSLFVILSLPAPFSVVRAQTVEAEIEKALSHHPELGLAIAEKRLAEQLLARSRAAGRPTLSATATATETWIDPSLAGTGLTTNALSRQSQFVGLTADVPLLAPGRRATVRGEKANAEASRLNTYRVRQTLILEVINSYAALEEAAALADIARRQASEGAAAAARVQDLAAEGYASALDVAASTATASDLRANAMLAEEQKAAAVLRLQALTRHPPPSRLAPLALPPVPFASAAEARAYAETHLVNLAVAEKETAAAEAALAAQRAARLPSLSASGTVGWQGAEGFDGQDRSGDIAAVSVFLSMPLYAGGQLSADRRAARAARDAARHAEAIDRQDLMLRIDLAWARYERARPMVRLARSIEDERKRILDGTRTAFSEAHVSLDAIWEAERAFLDASSRRITAEAAEKRAAFALLHAVGALEGARSLPDPSRPDTATAAPPPADEDAVLARRRALRDRR